MLFISELLADVEIGLNSFGGFGALNCEISYLGRARLLRNFCWGNSVRSGRILCVRAKMVRFEMRRGGRECL
jgi:hypothetical protein